jgi:hypothetical protein
MDDGHTINIGLIDKMLEQTLPAHRRIYETLLQYRGPVVLGFYSAFFEGSNFATVSIARGPMAQSEMDSASFIDHMKRAVRRNFGTQHEPE